MGFQFLEVEEVRGESSHGGYYFLGVELARVDFVAVFSEGMRFDRCRIFYRNDEVLKIKLLDKG